MLIWSDTSILRSKTTEATEENSCGNHTRKRKKKKEKERKERKRKEKKEKEGKGKKKKEKERNVNNHQVATVNWQ